MPQFYVPIHVKPEELYAGKPAHTQPTRKLPHFDSEKQAQAYLNKTQYQTPYYKNLTYGPNQETLCWPKTESIYRVEVSEPAKLKDMKEWETRMPGISNDYVGRTTLDVSNILSRKTTIYADALHTEPLELHDTPGLGERLSDEKIQQAIEQRGDDLERMYKILERSSSEEREKLDMNNPEHSDILKRVCVHNEPEGSLADRAVLIAQRKIGEVADINTVLSSSAIEAEFNARLEALPPTTPEGERIAIAMSGTLQKFAASISAKGALAINSLFNNIDGIINEAEASIDSQNISRHELGEDDFEKILKPHTQELQEDEASVHDDLNTDNIEY